MSRWEYVPPGVINKTRYKMREYLCSRCDHRTWAETAPECHGRRMALVR